ncbi:MAG: NAD(P)-binding domain-containing protein [Williamsia sp.]|nr:NAD(P)-binding domain-containing protein [Williamsia sp.]
MSTHKKKIGVLGSGIVGRVLGAAFLKEGHEVMLGTRNPLKSEVVKWKDENADGQAGSYAKAAFFGELLVLAVEGDVAKEVIQQAGYDNFTGKTVIDATNPITREAPHNGVLKYFTNLNESLMEQIQHLLPQAHIVKAFNSVGNALMYKPSYKDGKPSMFICGNDDEAKKTVTEILDAFGWEAEDMGKAESARAIEPLAILWCIPGFLKNEWGHAFKLLKN